MEPVPDEQFLSELASPELPLHRISEVAVHGLFTDGMVLQREMPVPVWGWGPEGAEVEVSFAGNRVKTKVAENRWSLKLPSMPSSGEGRELTISSGSRSIVLKDVLVGDVWLCAGQSNMQVEMKLDVKAYPQRAADIGAANNPLVRFYKVERASSRSPRRDVPAVWDDLQAPWTNSFFGNQWRPCTKEWVQHISATGFYFARDLQPKIGCPVGILVAARGSTSIDSWVPAEVINSEACWVEPNRGEDARKALAKVNSDWAKFITSKAAPWRVYKEKYPTQEALYKAQTTPGHEPIQRPRPAVWPSCFFNGMLHPVAPFAVKGVLWYQGESDGGLPAQYAEKMASLIHAWRGLWQRPDMPFIITQLAGFSGWGDGLCDTEKSGWAVFRAAQARVPGMVSNVYMTTLIDAGMVKNVHPYRKEIAGTRLSLVARKEIYKEPVAAYGPLFQSIAKEGSTLVVSFTNTEKGLLAKEVDLDGNLLPGGVLRGFTICGADQQFVKAEAKIEGDRVIVSSPQVADPVAVRYAWADFPLANLYNSEGLPGFPFQASAEQGAKK